MSFPEVFQGLCEATRVEPVRIEMNPEAKPVQQKEANPESPLGALISEPGS